MSDTFVLVHGAGHGAWCWAAVIGQLERRGDRAFAIDLPGHGASSVPRVQATLGMWTVTMLLKPVIVTLHLLGGMATLALLSWLALRQMALSQTPASALRLRPWAMAGLVIVICQIALGGWVSTKR